MFILNSDIPKELYSKLTISEEDLSTLTINTATDITHFTQYQGKSFIITNSFSDLIKLVKDTGISFVTTNSSYFPYPTLSFVYDKD